jgi:hypothetical protein
MEVIAIVLVAGLGVGLVIELADALGWNHVDGGRR